MSSPSIGALLDDLMLAAQTAAVVVRRKALAVTVPGRATAPFYYRRSSAELIRRYDAVGDLGG